MAHNFALIGAAGYIAPRHLRAIKDNGQNLVAAVDTNDSVGIIDNYFPDASFFIEFERFDRHCEKLRRESDQARVHYVTICSPNYLHDAHIRFALRADANAICEKPMVLNPWNAEALRVLQNETGRKVNTILQLRLHPSIIEFRDRVKSMKKGKKHKVVLTYITPRGMWYTYSWKGDVKKSGGIATNIGIHFFDMLIWMFGKVQKNVLHVSRPDKSAGRLELENADVLWFLSIDRYDLPKPHIEYPPKPFRTISVDNENIEFSEGFTDLHNLSYKEILNDNGFGINETLPSIEAVYNIRNAEAIGLKGDYHPQLKKIRK